MMDGFDLDSPLVCEGIIGDGCGGGRIFYIEKKKLFVYDPITKESQVLYETICDVQELTKNACIVIMKTPNGSLAFNLSKMELEVK